MDRSKLVTWGLVAALGLPAASAIAAPSIGPGNASFYTPPAAISGNQGDLIWYRPATVDLGPDAPELEAWNVLYRSTDALGAPNVVTGTVMVPTSNWSGWTARPVISYAVGTHGLAQPCAPSMQLANGTDYESANIAAALKAGYAVLVSDNPGYTHGDTPTYLAGKAQGHAVLDIVRAATQIPGSGVRSTAKLAIWGYSQGGQTASWAAELQKTYAPDLNLVGIAAGGTPADFPSIANFLDGNTGASFLMQAIIGLSTQYPDDIPLDELANDRGQAMIATAKQQCVFEALFDVMNESIAGYTRGSQTMPELLTIPSVNQRVVEQNLGQGQIAVPLYQYHGQADEFIPLEQHLALKEQYCQTYSNVTFDVFPSEHIVTQFQAAPHVLSWLGDRFSGKRAQGSCATTEPRPQSTANPGGGNFVVTLDQWPLDAAINLKTLGQAVNLPPESTFTADTDMTAETLNGHLRVPEFMQKLNILLPLDVKIAVEPTEPVSGSARIDHEGLLHVNGMAYTDITVASAGFGWLQIPFGCKTASSVAFPIHFDGPLSSLGNGNFRFGGTTTFPPMEGCGLFTGLFTVLMSGEGQTYSFTVKPPAPVRW